MCPVPFERARANFRNPVTAMPSVFANTTGCKGRVRRRRGVVQPPPRFWRGFRQAAVIVRSPARSFSSRQVGTVARSAGWLLHTTSNGLTVRRLRGWRCVRRSLIGASPGGGYGARPPRKLSELELAVQQLLYDGLHRARAFFLAVVRPVVAVLVDDPLVLFISRRDRAQRPECKCEHGTWAQRWKRC